MPGTAHDAVRPFSSWRRIRSRRRKEVAPPPLKKEEEQEGSFFKAKAMNEVDAGRRRCFYSWGGRERERVCETEYAPHMYDFFRLRVFHYSSTHLDGLQYMRK